MVKLLLRIEDRSYPDRNIENDINLYKVWKLYLPLLMSGEEQWFEFSPTT